MKRPTLHLLGIPHTITADPSYSHCAFTGKVKRFIPMMERIGYKVIHYGNGGPPAHPGDHEQIFAELELEQIIGPHDPRSPNFYGAHADVTSELYVRFNDRLQQALQRRVELHDIICCPFGVAHTSAVQGAGLDGKAYVVETGIGYDQTFAAFRVFESRAWQHYHYGKQSVQKSNNRGSDYDWVIPNYFDASEWKASSEPGEYVLFFGRICEAKGMAIFVELAKQRPDLKFVFCGQGESGWKTLAPNLEYRPPVFGKERSDLLRKAIAVVVPSRYVEPFGGVAVEAMLCGRPILASTFGAFEEILGPYSNQCRTLPDWMCALKKAEALRDFEHDNIRNYAEFRFDMKTLAHDYDNVFKQIAQLRGGGWYALDTVTWD